MDNLKILSLNARGLRDNLKRRKVWKYCKDNNVDICFLQETHGSNKDNHLWSNEFGNKGLFANGESNARGVATMFCKYGNKVREVIRDINGRFILIKLELEEYTYCLANIYAPNTDNPLFFNELFGEIKKLDCVHVIIGGDFNVDLDPNVDRSEPIWYNNAARQVIKDFNETEEFCDIWRVQNTDQKCFTWVKTKPRISWSRIDYFLCSNNLINLINKTDILPCVFSDHSAIHIEIVLNDHKKGPGVWKFNDSHLKNKEFVDKMSELIKGIIRVYDYLEKIALWELIKSECIKLAKDYGKAKARTERCEKFKLYKLLSTIQEYVVNDKASDNMINNMSSVINEINSFEEKATKSAMFRCKANWYNTGELPTKFFFNLEKRNYVKKCMYIARRSDGTLTKDYKEILNLQYEYYEELYRFDPNVSFNIQNEIGVRLNQMEKSMFDENFSVDELFDAQMTLKSGKCPGPDGLSLAFYRTFWKLLAKPLFDALQTSVQNKMLNPSARRGIINLIPKKGRDSKNLSGWRGISLLNYDYKIYAKMIANRLELATHLIGKQQNGFVKGRSLTTNIATCAQIISYLNKTNNPGVIALIDFEKCFDKIAHQSIKAVFKYFNFGEQFIQMVMLLFTKIELCTVNNGFLSDIFVKGKGINQGCPGSPLIYSFCGEILNHLMYLNPNVNGIPIDALHNVLSQFADDTGAFLKYEQLCISSFSETLEHVEAQMGLKVSYEKTVLYRVGSLYKTNARLYESISVIARISILTLRFFVIFWEL